MFNKVLGGVFVVGGTYVTYDMYSAIQRRNSFDNMPGSCSQYERVCNKQNNADLHDFGMKYGCSYANAVGINWDSFGFVSEPYWSRNAIYRVDAEAAIVLRNATYELHSMCLEVVDEVVNRPDLLRRLHIPEHAWSMIKTSWDAKDPDVLGRFDFAIDKATGLPKLLEYNADTPTTLIESGVMQRNWVTGWQFNILHEMMTSVLESLAKSKQKVCFAYQHLGDPHERNEEQDTITYVSKLYDEQATAIGGQHSNVVDIECMEAQNGQNGGRIACFVDGLERGDVDLLWKLYPWEWLVSEEFGYELCGVGAMHNTPPNVAVCEPAWKMILSNKGLLPLLWERYPNHPYLVEAYFDQPLDFRTNDVVPWVIKPLFGREAIGIRKGNVKSNVEDPPVDIYGGSVYQRYVDVAPLHGRHWTVGSWVIRGQPSALSFREDIHDVVSQNSCFVAHELKDKPSQDTPQPNQTPLQSNLRRSLYGEAQCYQPWSDKANVEQIKQNARRRGVMFYNNWARRDEQHGVGGAGIGAGAGAAKTSGPGVATPLKDTVPPPKPNGSIGKRAFVFSGRSSS
eukprot:PhF_6_TR42846/c0_g1_i2/m.64888